MSSVPPGGRQDYTPKRSLVRPVFDQPERVDSLTELAHALRNQPAADAPAPNPLHPDAYLDRAPRQRSEPPHDPLPPGVHTGSKLRPFVSAGEAARMVVDDVAAKRFAALEDEITVTRAEDIAAIARALTYGEMIEFAAALFRCAPDGGITKDNLPAVIHRWATMDKKRAQTPNQKEARPQHQEARTGDRVESREASRDAGAGEYEGEGTR